MIYTYLLVSTVAFAQSLPDTEAVAEVTIKAPLGIGDNIPEDFWNREHLLHEDGAITRQSLQQYRGQLLILDFWASWCSPCIAAFPLIDSLDQQFAEVSLIKVTRDPQSLDPHTKSIIADTTLGSYFPHRIIPHFVWISPQGTVQAITSMEQINAETIQQALGSAGKHWQDKYDLDYSQPLFLRLPDSTRVLDSYASLIKGTFKGLPSAVKQRKSDGRTVGMSITNRSLHLIYQTIARGLILSIDSSYLHSPFVLEVANDNALAFGVQYSDPHNVVYTYDIEVAQRLQDRLYEMALSDINSRTDFVGAIEWRETDALELQIVGDTEYLYSSPEVLSERQITSERICLANTSLHALLHYWNAGNRLGKQVVDATGIRQPIHIEIPNSHDLFALNMALQRYGLALQPKRVALPCFVVRDKQPMTRPITNLNQR